MAPGKLAEIAILAAAMPAVIGLTLWGSVELLGFAGIVRTPVPVPTVGVLAGPQQLEGTIVKMDQAKHEIALSAGRPRRRSALPTHHRTCTDLNTTRRSLSSRQATA